MWKSGTYNGYEYEAKVYKTGSNMGIEGGKVSKLTLKKNGKTVARYDRGWDIEPIDLETVYAVDAIVKRYDRLRIIAHGIIFKLQGVRR